MKAKQIDYASIFSCDKNFFSQLTNYSNNQYHNHEFYEIVYVIDGKAYQTLNDTESLISVGDLYILRPSDAHRFRAYENNDFIHRDILVKTEMFDEIVNFISSTFLDKLTNFPEPPSVKLSSTQIANLEQSLNLTNYYLGSVELYEILFKKIVIEIIALVLEKNISIANNRPQWINNLIEAFSNPYMFSRSVIEITGSLHYNMSYICRTFKKYVGQSMTSYFSSVKLEHAYMLLQTTDITIDKILEIINYNNITHFYRDFKKHFNVTPSVARKKVKSK